MRHSHKTSSIFLMLISWYLSGCHSSAIVPSPAARAMYATQRAQSMGWKPYTITTTTFTLRAFGAPAKKNTKIITIYIEGDGLGWLTSDTPSDNPTPIVPTGLHMAMKDKQHSPVVYLARPCQYVLQQQWQHCRAAYWTNLRFSPVVIDAMNQAVDHIKHDYHAQKIILIGYSGGGTIAALLAAKRTDIIKLFTVAAILETKQWARQQNLTPLQGSLNPADVWQNLMEIPQVHWVGGKDAVVKKETAFAFAKRFPAAKQPKIIVIPMFDHHCCWATEQFDLKPF